MRVDGGWGRLREDGTPTKTYIRTEVWNIRHLPSFEFKIYKRHAKKSRREFLYFMLSCMYKFTALLIALQISICRRIRMRRRSECDAVAEDLKWMNITFVWADFFYVNNNCWEDFNGNNATGIILAGPLAAVEYCAAACDENALIYV